MNRFLCVIILPFIFTVSVFSQVEPNPHPTPAVDKYEKLATEEEQTTESEGTKYNVQINYSTESLTKNLGVWKTTSLFLERKLKKRQLVWMNYTLSDRKSVRDQYLEVGTYKPLSNRWAITAEAGFSPTHKFAGKFSVKGEVEKGFTNGIVIHGGSRFTAFSAVKAATVYGQAEKYWGENRVAYTLSVTKISTAGTAPSHRFQYNRYYGDRTNSFGVAASYGRENENLGLNLGILTSKTASITISEKHWLTKNFGINVNATIHRQGTFYYRRGVNVGIHYRF
jgi:YaiO family outer membrane protein